MTDPSDDLPPDGSPLDDAAPDHTALDDAALDDAALDDAALAQLRALLREEPVEDDEPARERRIRAALDAAPRAVTSAGDQRKAGAVGRTVPAPVPAPRRSPARPWLVAAAVLAVVGIGGLVALRTSGSATSDSAEVATADRSTTGSATASEESGAPGVGGMTTTTAPSATGSAADLAATQVADLGSYPDVAALRAALDAPRSADAAPVRPPAAPPPEAQPCVDQQLATGTEVLGIARVGTALVVVVTGPDGPTVLDATTCSPTA